MVNRQTITANTETEYNFDTTMRMFLVKNFTASPIIVCVDEYEESKGYKIPANTAQKICEVTKKLVIKGESAGEVEVDV